MNRKLSAIAVLILSLTAGCEIKKEDTAAATPTEAATATPNAQESAAKEFSVESVPVTTASLPPFPFFDVPQGLTSLIAEKRRIIPFDAQYFMAGDKPVKVEGKIYHDRFGLTRDRQYSELEFHRNYENAIRALGGAKISTSQYTQEIADSVGGFRELDKYSRGASPRPDYEHATYLIRTPDKEYWIEISTGSYPLHGYVVVLEKQVMTQSLGFLEASQIKQELDRSGRVALYVNFDTGKATLRPDANLAISEVNKLLSQDATLKLSIEGHTDNTGNAQKNRELSTARARSVLGALVGMGIDPSRLRSRGFGPDKPIADNRTDEGRAKNRRVELVKF